MKKTLPSLLLIAGSLFSDAAEKPSPRPEGWSVDIGGQYTWMALTTPPTYSGSTGGVVGKITCQKPGFVYGEIRSIYNTGSLSSSLTSSNLYEWYSEAVAGYCFGATSNFSVTPYAGLGLEFLRDNLKAYSSISAIDLKYRIYYAVVGFDARYTGENWYMGLQADCLPTFDQFLEIKGISGSAWKLTKRVGADVKIPIGCRLVYNLWLEASPYYRFLPIGKSDVLDLPHRNLNQWGGFVTLRLFL